MKNKIQISSQQVRRFLVRKILALYLVLAVLLIYALTFSVISSLRYAKSFQQNTSGLKDDDGHVSAELGELLARRAFVEARLVLVNTDSVSLAINLADSAITIEQHGVVLHSAVIKTMQVSRVFSRIGSDDLSIILGSPLTVYESFSTIARKKYTVKTIPDGTSGPVPLALPDAAPLETVCFLLRMDRGIQLDIRQLDAPDGKVLKNYERQLLRAESRRIFNDLTAFRVPDYHPVIQIGLDQKDARAIYKALPVHAKIAVRI